MFITWMLPKTQNVENQSQLDFSTFDSILKLEALQSSKDFFGLLGFEILSLT